MAFLSFKAEKGDQIGLFFLPEIKPSEKAVPHRTAANADGPWRW